MADPWDKDITTLEPSSPATPATPATLATPTVPVLLDERSNKGVPRQRSETSSSTRQSLDRFPGVGEGEKANSRFPDVGFDVIVQDEDTLSQGDRDARPKGIISNVQTKLNALGLDVGDVDGVIGRKTSRAIQEAQQMLGFPRTGVLDKKTLLGLTTLSPDQIKYLKNNPKSWPYQNLGENVPVTPSGAVETSPRPNLRPVSEIKSSVVGVLPKDIAKKVEDTVVTNPEEINKIIFDGANFSGEIPTPSKGEDVVTWIAKNTYGIEEDNKDFRKALKALTNGVIDPVIESWCAAFVGHVLRNVGQTLPERAQENPNLAFNYQDLGEGVYDHNPKTGKTFAGSLSDVQAGDVIIFSKGGPGRDKNGSFTSSVFGHISIVVGVQEDGSILAMGGNQMDRVQTSRYTPAVIAENFPGGYKVRRLTNNSLEKTSPEVIAAITKDMAEGGAGD